MNKIRLGLIFGGKSAEHEISILSAKNIVEALDSDKYDITYILIGDDGKWHLNNSINKIIGNESIQAHELQNYIEDKGNEVTVILGREDEKLVNINENMSLSNIDVIFPILHGPFGEDGTIQGLLKLGNIPYVGCDVLSSAICMDKDVSKRLLRDAGIKVCNFLTFKDSEKQNIKFENVVSELGIPMFVKPCNLGSSVGITKVHNEEEFYIAINEAFLYDKKIIIEENIVGREIECAVLGANKVIASLPGEIILNDEFYSYETKYLDEHGAILAIPARLTDEEIKRIQTAAINSFNALNCEGMARVDFFLTSDDELYVNELNTIPGFTKISMYPKLFEVSGISYGDLIDKLIGIAIDRFNSEQKLKTKVDFK